MLYLRGKNSENRDSENRGSKLEYNNIRNCPVCGNNNYAYIYTHRIEPIDGVNFLNAMKVVVCADCGMAYVASTPSKEIIDDYYRNFSKYEPPIDRKNNSPVSSDLAEYRKKIVAHIINVVDYKDSLVVDVGCGDGWILKEMSHQGYKSLIGLELSSINCEIIRSFGCSVINKSLFEITTDDFKKSPDCIVLHAVLEHMADCKLAIDIIASIMDDETLLFIVVPQLDYFFYGDNYPFEEISVEHLNYFSLDSLELLMKLHGLVLREYRELSCGSSAVLSAVFKKSKSRSDLMKNYILKSSKIIQATVELVNDYAKTQRPIVIYGAGTLCQYLLANTNMSKCNILSIVDGNENYHGKKLCGFLICNPNSLYDERERFINADIFIISYHFGLEIENNILRMGLENRRISLPIERQ